MPAGAKAQFELETDDFLRALDEEVGQLVILADTDLDDLGATAADRMVAYCPIGPTGKLVRSIDSVPGDDDLGHFVDVGTFGVFYSLFVEMGTSVQSGQPFIRPGLEEAVASLAPEVVG